MPEVDLKSTHRSHRPSGGGAFTEHLSKKGSVAEGISTQFGHDAFAGVDPYQGKTIVAHKGPYLVGAVGFEKDQDGEQRLAELMKEVK